MPVRLPREGGAMSRTVVEPVGKREIAERLGVAHRTVEQWQARDLGFPAPRWRVSGVPAWDWRDVAEWAAETGRA